MLGLLIVGFLSFVHLSVSFGLHMWWLSLGLLIGRFPVVFFVCRFSFGLLMCLGLLMWWFSLGLLICRLYIGILSVGFPLVWLRTVFFGFVDRSFVLLFVYLSGFLWFGSLVVLFGFVD